MIYKPDNLGKMENQTRSRTRKVSRLRIITGHVLRGTNILLVFVYESKIKG